MKQKQLFGLIMLLCCFGMAFGLSPLTSNSSYIPRVYLLGNAGTSELGQGDVLAPIMQGVNSNLFFYGEGRYAYARQSWAKNPWAASAGFGFRQLVGNAVILGAYVLGDYMKTATDHNLKQIAPGIELLSRTWDFRANGYLPIGKKSWTKEGWADTFGDYSHISFSGHDQYDAWYIYHEESGPGFDAEIGRTLFDIHKVLVKGYVNGYFFNMSHHTDVKGVGARVTIQPNTYLEVSLNDSYDKYNKNEFEAGLRVSLYDLFNDKSNVLDNNNLQWRLFTPIERNFGEIAFGDDTRITGGPDDGGQPTPEPPPGPTWYGHTTPEKTNVWFFYPGLLTATKSSNGIGGNGTYEHPYTSYEFNQSTVDAIHQNAPGATFYFTKGTYIAYTAGTPFQPIRFYDGQSVWGRMGAYKGYQEPATGINRQQIQFVGALQLGSNSSINDVWVHNDRALLGNSFATTGGVILDGATHVSFDNVEVGAGMRPDNAMPRADADLSINANNAYNVGATIKNGAEVDLIKNSQFYGYAPNSTDPTVTGAEGIGLDIQNGAKITKIEESDFSGVGGDGCDNDTGKAGDAGNGYGIKAVNGVIAIGQIDNSMFLGNGGGGGGGADTIEDRGVIYPANQHGIIGGGGGNYGIAAGGGLGGAGYGVFISGASHASINSISGSKFYGNVNSADISLIGFDGTFNLGGILGGDGAFNGADGGNGSGLTIDGATTVTIGNISHSGFYGNTNVGNVGAIGNSNPDGDNYAGILGGGGYGSDNEAGDGFGLAIKDAGAVSVGTIDHSDFYGNANAGDVGIIGSAGYNVGGMFGGSGIQSPGLGGDGYGVFLENATSAQFGDVTNSWFYGNANSGAVDYIGSKTKSNRGGIFGGGASYQNGNGGNGYGMFVNGISGTFNIGSLNQSWFYGNANSGTVEIIGSDSTNDGGIFGGGGFDRAGTGGNGAGLLINNVSGVTEIGLISSSKFYGNANSGSVNTIGSKSHQNWAGIFGGGGMRRYTVSQSNGGDGCGLYFGSVNGVVVAGINSSQFYGNANSGVVTLIGSSGLNSGGIFGGGGSGYYYRNDGGQGGIGAGLYMDAVSNNININYISGSAFFGNSNSGNVTTIGSNSPANNYGGIFGDGASGYNHATYGGNGGNAYGLYFTTTNNITVGAISGNHIGANTDAIGENRKTDNAIGLVTKGIGTGFYVDGVNTVLLGAITGNTFVSTSKYNDGAVPIAKYDSFIDLTGAAITIDNIYGINNVANLKAYLDSVTNTYTENGGLQTDIGVDGIYQQYPSP